MILSLYEISKTKNKHLGNRRNEGFALLHVKILTKIQSLVTQVFGPEKEKQTGGIQKRVQKQAQDLIQDKLALQSIGKEWSFSVNCATSIGLPYGRKRNLMSTLYQYSIKLQCIVDQYVKCKIIKFQKLTQENIFMVFQQAKIYQIGH